MVTSPADTHFIQFCIAWSSVALLYYDYALTFGMEVRYIWTQKFRVSSILYFCCRYSLIANVVYLLTIANKVTGNCHAGYFVCSSLSVVGRTAIIIVWTVRAYAVFGRNRSILVFFGLNGLMIFILDIMDILNNSCSGDKIAPIVRGLLITAMCVFEVCSAVLTTFRSIQALSIFGPWWKQRRYFTYLVLEQGILYFCVVAALTVSSLVLNFTIPGGFFQRLLNAYTIPLSGLLTARFLLHLRKWEDKCTVCHASCINVGQESSEASSTLRSLNFSSPTCTCIESSRVDLEMELDSGQTPPLMDQFGDDPVRRARERDYAGVGSPRVLTAGGLKTYIGLGFSVPQAEGY